MTKQIEKNLSTYCNAGLIIIATLLLCSISAVAQDKIVRKELYTAEIGSRTIKKIDVREIDFKPLQKTGYHKHPCPVISYIVPGTVFFQIEGDSLRTLQAGDVAYEPANKPIVRFDNASSTEPLIFIPYYLLNDEKELIEMLPEK